MKWTLGYFCWLGATGTACPASCGVEDGPLKPCWLHQPGCLGSAVVPGAVSGAAGGRRDPRGRRAGQGRHDSSIPAAGIPIKGYTSAGWRDDGMETPGKNELRKQMSSVGPVV